MANLEEMSATLLTRFKGVPKITLEDCTDWMAISFIEHGFRLDRAIPVASEPLVLLYAEADGVTQIALRTAYYFEYRDGEEAVDKSMISDQYKSLSDKLWERYFRKKSEGTDGTGGSAFYVMPRIDR